MRNDDSTAAHDAGPRAGVSIGRPGVQGGELPRIPPILWLLSSSFFLVYLGIGAFQQFISPYLLTRYHLAAGVSNAVLATVYLVAFVCLIVSTYSTAILGEYLALVLAMLTYGLFGVAVLLTGNVIALVLAAVAWGWGASVLWTAGSALVLDLAGAGSYGRFSGTLYTGVYVGQGLGVLLLGALANLPDPRAMVVCAATLTLVGAGIALFLPRTRHVRARPAVVNPFAVLANPTTRTAAFILFLSSSGFGLLLGVFGQVVTLVYGLAAVAWLTAGFYVARIPSGSVGGRLIDRWGRGSVLGTAFLTAAAALVLAALLHNAIVLALCAVALGVEAAVVPVGLMTWVGDHARAEDRPSTYAAVSLWSNMGTGLTILAGQSLLHILGGWQVAFAFFAALFLICAILARRLV